MKLKYSFLFVFLLVQSFAFAQQDAQFSQYMFNQLYLNPAYAGTDTTYMNMSITYRNQWTGYSPTFDDGGAPSTTLVSFNMPLKFLGTHHGLGLQYFDDKLGPLNNRQLLLSYAYHFRFKNGFFSIGARGGFFNQSLNYSILRPTDPNDPLLAGTGDQNQYKPDFAAGIYLRVKYYYIGIAVNHLSKSSFNYGMGLTGISLNNHYTVNGGADLPISDNVTLSPTAIFKSDLNSISYEGSLIGTFKGQYFLGTSLRNSNKIDDLVAIAGINLLKDKSLRISYAFDYVLSGKQAKAGSSHEMMVAYRMLAPKPKLRYMVRTPRFRF
ncbi:MAG: type IX secretion system membrane protein PorP/SprF [Bacteroidetes bacterium]|nr:MAG: type IX secretion system membrane protein PorP/SprF [Bacteroidota bacterium]